MRPRAWLHKILSPSVYRRLARSAKIVLGWWWRNDLTRLAILFQTDKGGNHKYTQHYQRYFQPIKGRKLNLLEIGVGGYENSDQGGESLRMWKAYFRSSRIIGIDVYDKTHFREERIDIRRCDETDSESLRHLSSEYGGFDIVIDDGSHVNENVVKTFHLLFPLLRPNGIYVVEDTQTAYWPSLGGGIGNPQTSMAFFKGLVDGLNHAEYPVKDYKPDYFDQNIVEIAFLHNLVFIRKGSNNETTNAPDVIQRELAAAT
jgi:hypothetical protein